MSRPGGSGRRNITDGESLASQGDAFASQGLLEEALFKYDEALRADQDFHHRNPNHPHVAMRYCSIGALYRASGDDDAALEYFAKAARVEERSDGCSRRTALASYLSNLGGVFRSKGDNDGAIDAYVRALVHLKKAMPAVAEIENVVAAEESAAFALESDRFDKRALSYPIDRREITTEQDTECMLGHSGFLNTASSVLNNLGVLYKALGEPKSARRLYLRAISLAVIAVGEFDPSGAARYRNLGAALHDMGHYERALMRFTQAADMCALGYGRDHPETVLANEWVLYAAEEKKSNEHKPRDDAKKLNARNRQHVLPPVAEWFVSQLRCGVLEPPADLPLPEEEQAMEKREKDASVSAVRATMKQIAATTKTPPPLPVGDDGTVTPMTVPATTRPPLRNGNGITLLDIFHQKPRSPNRGIPQTPVNDAKKAAATSRQSAATPVRDCLPVGKRDIGDEVPKRVATRIFAPLEPNDGEDLLSPYTRPRTVLFGGDDASPIWNTVSDERALVQTGGTALPLGKDYIKEYLDVAPSYANLITPFEEMPVELLMPYSAYKGYGVPRPASLETLPRLKNRPRDVQKTPPGGGRPSSVGGRASEFGGWPD